MMPQPEIKQALDLFHKACMAEENGEMFLAEVFYLKSIFAFEEAGGDHIIETANALNALAFLRKARGNHKGAIFSAKKSLQITKKFETQYSNPDVELIRMGAWELIDQLNECEDSIH